MNTFTPPSCWTTFPRVSLKGSVAQAFHFHFSLSLFIFQFFLSESQAFHFHSFIFTFFTFSFHFILISSSSYKRPCNDEVNQGARPHVPRCLWRAHQVSFLGSKEVVQIIEVQKIVDVPKYCYFLLFLFYFIYLLQQKKITRAIIL